MSAALTLSTVDRLLMLECAPSPTDEELARFSVQPMPRSEARVIVWDYETNTGLKSVMDIIEGPYAWTAVKVALENNPTAFLGIEQEDGTVLSLDRQTGLKTKRARIRTVLKALEARYKTGLDIRNPDSKSGK